MSSAIIALTTPALLAQAPMAALETAEFPISTDQAESALSQSYEPLVPIIPIEPVLEVTAQGTRWSSAGAAGRPPLNILVLDWALSGQTNIPPEGPQNDLGNEDQPPDESEQSNEIIVEGEYGPPEGDPMAVVNETSYRITQQLDDVFVEPIAYAYRDGLPGPIRDGLGNVVRNLGEPNNALNFLLQGKIGKTFETLGRFVINSTLGIGGLIDIAEKPGIALPYRRNGFGNTFGFYGIGPGPYLYLPVTGATTPRDFIGSGLDQLLLPVAFGEPFNRLEFTVPFYVVSNLDARLEFDDELRRIDDTVDPYAARRDTYLYRRARTIAELRGEEPPEPPAILQEVEGTGEFADPPEVEPAAPPISDEDTPETQAETPGGETAFTVPELLMITRRSETEPTEDPAHLAGS
ncbi:MAG: VacJ family lipoprotein [Pseudomonadota bacterium]